MFSIYNASGNCHTAFQSNSDDGYIIITGGRIILLDALYRSIVKLLDYMTVQSSLRSSQIWWAPELLSFLRWSLYNRRRRQTHIQLYGWFLLCSITTIIIRIADDPCAMRAMESSQRIKGKVGLLIPFFLVMK